MEDFRIAGNIYLISYTFIYVCIKFYFRMDNSSDTVLKKELLLVSKSFAVSRVLTAIFSYYVIKTIPSNAESR